MPEVATEYIRECAKFKMTALALAIANGHEEAAKMLINPVKAAGALNVQDGTGRSALMIAVDKGLISIAQQLLAAGAKPELTDANDMTALHVASESEDAAAVQTLLKHRADVAASDKVSYIKAVFFCSATAISLQRGCSTSGGYGVTSHMNASPHNTH